MGHLAWRVDFSISSANRVHLVEAYPNSQYHFTLH